MMRAMHTRIFSKVCFAFLPAFLFEIALRGAVIPGVTVVDVSSEFVTGTDQRRATNLVNGGGLFGDAHTTVPQGAMWLTSPTTEGEFTNAYVTFDLGALRTLNQMKVWNYNEGGTSTQRGIQRADILTADSDQVFTNNFPNVFFNRAPGTFTNFAQTISLGGVRARYVRINVLTNHYVSGAAENRVGLSEVQFIDNTVPPTVVSASRNFSNDRVTVLFSEPVLASTALISTNYSIQSGTTTATVSGVTLDPFANRVVLQTSTLNSNLVYTLSAQNVRDAADLASIPANSQVTIQAELALWLKADAGVTADASGFVSQWADQSGSGNHAAQTDSSAQPVRVDAAVNGKPVLQFDGVGTFLEIPPSSSLTVERDFTIYAVSVFDDFANYNGIFAKTAVNLPAPFDFYLSVNSGRPSLFRGNGSGYSSFQGASAPTNGQACIISAIVGGTNGTLYLNGAFNGGGALTAGVGDVGLPARVGNRDDLVTRLKGSMAELIFIRGAVSSAERSAIDTYLGTKYGIAIVSLEITGQPAAVQAVEGRTATFTVSVSANSPQISYQWQRNQADIIGATNFTYTTPVLTLGDNNTSYRVRVSIPGTSRLSDAAALTVVADVEPPTVLAAGKRIWNPSEIVVVFSEPVSLASATNRLNYSLDQGATVGAAALGDPPDRVVLSATGLGPTNSLTVQNVRDLFSNTVVQTSVQLGLYPAPLALWLKADSGVVADAAGLVSEWDDQSGNANHATQPNGTDLMPTLITNGFNGKPTIRFDGVDDYLVSASSPSLAITGDMSIYAVAKFVDFANYNSIVGKTTGNLPASYDLYTVQDSGIVRFYRGNGGNALGQVSGIGIPSLGVPHLVCVTMRGTAVSHFLDGQTNGTGVLATTLADNGDPLYTGSRGDLFTKMKGDFAEILIFGAALSDTDRTAIDGYLGSKYGIVVGASPPPSISIGPSGGSTITLSWPASSFTLESALDLTGPIWTAITNGIVTSGGTNSFTANAASGTQQFFRLHKP